MKFEIPKKFHLLGHEYKIELIDDLYEKEDVYGEADPERKLIRLQKAGAVNRIYKKKSGVVIRTETVEITQEDLVETYYHELVHIILDAMGESKLYSDEKFVSVIGKCLMEIEKTKINQDV